jgi:IPT/TIG domain
VSFNGQAATPIAVSATQITVAVPGGAPNGPVSVIAPGGTAVSAMSFIATSVAAPTISGVSPSPAGQGATITIAGTGFDPSPSRDKVFINGRNAIVVSASSTAITALVPAATSGFVSVITPHGTARSASRLVVPPLPYLSSNVGSVVNSAIGGSATSSVASAGQIGLILFDATAGQQMSMQVTATSYGPDGSAITSTVIPAGTFIDRQILTHAGTYTVLIAPGSGQTGAATLSLNVVPPDATATNATPVSLTTTVPGQNMTLTFNGTANQCFDYRQKRRPAAMHIFPRILFDLFNSKKRNVQRNEERFSAMWGGG